jgi:hypothetical protein
MVSTTQIGWWVLLMSDDVVCKAQREVDRLMRRVTSACKAALNQSRFFLVRSSLRPPKRSKTATTIRPRTAQARMQICVIVIVPPPVTLA